MRKRFSNESEMKAVAKELKRFLELLKTSVFFVEGKRDAGALRKAGILDTVEISGKLKSACEKCAAERVIVLTDLDESGDELAFLAKEELERYGIMADIELRKRIGAILNLRFFEEFHKKLEKVNEEIKY
ncbi:hypothetical protein HZC08_01505 [Candidatus Micrarchaeota archaeon]|nr:hypothetical protein [Candidatus Micrarchaeota archaeon]